MQLSKFQKLPLHKLRLLAREAASRVEFLDTRQERDQEAVNIAARELAFFASVIEWKLANKKNKKFAY
tara:strand:+ start:223 stop:426 length:204 start_codon:yes stop_codon:yes gene_type:complete